MLRTNNEYVYVNTFFLLLESWCAGVKCVRGGEIFEVRDEAGIILNDPMKPDERTGGRSGTKRRLRIALDPAQYYADLKVRSCATS